ncbi:MAG: sulfatase-like hydrolase/transferase [Treponema sp.]|nr:sulfatase-like hydrolase/transferase [Treponema sp.]
MRGKKPNIVFIECDSMDGRAFGAMGFSPLKQATPALDRIARDGVMFERAYSNNPICCCSRASMVSGQYTYNCHAWNNYKGIPQNQPTFFTEFEKAGYQMGIFGKTDYVSGNHTQRARVTAWLRTANLRLPEYNDAKPEIIESQEKCFHRPDWEKVDQSVEFLKNHAVGEKPFFLYVGFGLPHPAFKTSRYYLDMINQESIKIPPKDIQNHPVMEYQRISKAWRYGFDPEDVKKLRAIYYGMIAETDAMTGKVLEALRGFGLEDNTIVIFTSDHGEMAMEHEQFYKSNMYEPAVRIPLLMKGPGIKKGLKLTRGVSLIDIFPTLLDFADLTTTIPLDGHSLEPELTGGKSNLPDLVFSEYHDGAVNASTSMIVQGDWKYIAFAGGYEPLLFNLKDDPWEIHNLAATYPDRTAEMKAALYRISDLDKVGSRVKEYEQDCFRVWRDEQKEAGTYLETMSRIYSGWDHPEQLVIKPWNNENEQKVLAWLEEVP